MKPQSKKAKGSRLERLVAKMLVDSGLDQFAHRTPLSGAIKGLKEDVMTKLLLQIEVKNQELLINRFATNFFDTLSNNIGKIFHQDKISIVLPFLLFAPFRKI